jgi:peptidoglycan/LPS O-acetylase OafA/YrhL
MYSGPAPWTLWFITMLMLLYLATPLFLNFIEKPLYFFILIGAIMMATIILDILYKGVDTRLLLYLPCYGLGLYSSRYSFSDKFVNNKTAFITLMIGIISTLINTESILFTQLKHIPLVISSSYLILSFSHSHEEQLPSFQIIEFLSYSSFSIYLFHRPIFITLKSLYFPESGMLQIVYLMSICMLSICIISWLAHVNAAANPQIIAAVFCH